MQGHQADSGTLRVFLVFHDQGDVIEEAFQGLEIRQGADQFLQVFQPSGGFDRFVLLPHLGITAFVQDHPGDHDMALAG